MKKFIFTLLSITLLFSCQDPVMFPDSTSEGSNNTESNFQVDFDGQTFTANQISATFLSGVINITGFRGTNGEYVILTVHADSPGTYQLGLISQTVVNTAAYGTESGAIPFVAAMDGSQASFGEVIITEIDTTNKLLSGSFEFTGHKTTVDANGNQVNESKEFTNGLFTNITYTDDLGGGGGNNNSDYAMTAKINGVYWEVNNPFGTNEFSNTNIFNYFPITDFVLLQGREGLFTVEIDLWLKRDDIVIGTYQIGEDTFDTPPSHFIDLIDNTNSISEITKQGVIVITEVNSLEKIVQGTFEFTTVDELVPNAPIDFNITEGTFRYKYE